MKKLGGGRQGTVAPEVENLVEAMAVRVMSWKNEFFQKRDEEYPFREIAHLRALADMLAFSYGDLTLERAYLLVSFIPFLNPNVPGNDLMFKMIRFVGEKGEATVREVDETMRQLGYTWDEVNSALHVLLHKFRALVADEKNGNGKKAVLKVNLDPERWRSSLGLWG